MGYDAGMAESMIPTPNVCVDAPSVLTISNIVQKIGPNTKNRDRGREAAYRQGSEERQKLVHPGCSTDKVHACITMQHATEDA